MAQIEVGIVVALYRYPVKSMRGEAIDQTHVHWNGLDGDRRYAFVQTKNRTNFPWLTGRQVADLLRYTPRFVDPADPVRSPLIVRTPDGRDLPLDSDELRAELAQRHGQAIYLIQIGSGTYDSGMGISLMSRSSLRALGEGAGLDLDERCFRQNIVIEAYEDTPFIEDSWLDHALCFGDRSDRARVRLHRAIPRCMMINLDPDTAAHDPRVLREVVQKRDNLAGVYGATERVGMIRVGDVLRLEMNHE